MARRRPFLRVRLRSGCPSHASDIVATQWLVAASSAPINHGHHCPPKYGNHCLYPNHHRDRANPSAPVPLSRVADCPFLDAAKTTVNTVATRTRRISTWTRLTPHFVLLPHWQERFSRCSRFSTLHPLIPEPSLSSKTTNHILTRSKVSVCLPPPRVLRHRVEALVPQILVGISIPYLSSSL